MIKQLSVQRRRVIVLAAYGLLPLFAAMSSAPAAGQDVVWTWSRQCKAEQQLSVTVGLEGKALYEGLLPICRGARYAEDGRIEFHLTSRHLFSSQHRARKTEIIEGDIWQASGDMDAFILGISFATKHQILLNTLHVAKVGTKNSTQLDKGLYVTTYPVVVR